MSQKLIIALDFENDFEAIKLVNLLDPATCALKIGSEMFTRFGPEWVQTLQQMGFKIFLDLKFHDIPTTVARACKAAAELGVWMVNVHAVGGLRMMQAAYEALEPYGTSRPLLIAVTVLTSMTSAELLVTGVHETLTQQTCALARLAQAAQFDGVVSAGFDVPLIKAACGQSFLCVTPGIRLSVQSNDDQTRVMIPTAACEAGSDFLVVGRSITRALNPGDMVRHFLSLMIT